MKVMEPTPPFVFAFCLHIFVADQAFGWYPYRPRILNEWKGAMLILTKLLKGRYNFASNLESSICNLSGNNTKTN